MAEDYKQLDKDYIVNVYNRVGAVLDHGKGSILYDVNGKKYIDLSAGIAVNIFGVCDEVWEKAVEAQLHKLSHISNVFYTEPQTVLAKKLCEKTGLKKVFFSNSGAEANECAIKTARKYSHDKYGDGRFTIVSLINSFHGRTLGTLAATGQDSLHEDFGPFPPGFVYAKADDYDDMVRLCTENKVCAIMLEMVQGEGGVHPLDKEYVQKVAEFAHAHDILIIVDEVQTGNGRTGYLYAYMGYGIQPDIVTTAKAIGGGLPLGATMFADSTQHVLTSHTHGSTFGGNPICTAGGVSIIDRLTDELMAEVREKGQYIKEELEQCQHVDHVSGLGMMIGVALKDKALADVVEGCVDNGVLVLTANGLLRLLPPLNIPWDELKEGITIVKKVIDA